MNALDRLDRTLTDWPVDTYFTINRAHLRALLDVARAAQVAGVPSVNWVEQLDAALAPLLEDTDA